MSLILDALKKSEREQDGSSPLEAEEPVPGASVTVDDHRVRWLFASVAVLALLVLVLLVVLLWPRGGDKTPTTMDTVPTPAVDAGTVRAPVANVPQPAAPGGQDMAPKREADPQVQALYQTQVATGVETVVEPQVKTIEPATTYVPTDRERAAALWQEMREEREAADQKLRQMVTPAQPSPPKPVEQAAAPVEPAAEAADAPADGLAGFADVPFLHELSVPVQNTIPTLMYSAHDYTTGSVTINKRQWREGDTLAENLVLEKLLADGIVLRINDRRFKLSALNSWVNY